VNSRTAVAVGGGTGLPIVLRCLLTRGFETTAVVTMADDGGSSGRLREALGILPPGDVRNCLVALAEPDNELARVFQYRLGGTDDFPGHAIGNLVIAALTDLKGGFAEAVEAAGRLLGARGRVLPSTLADVVLSGVDAAGRMVTGQANVARAEGPIARVTLASGRAPGYAPVLEALRQADVIVIGPGSLFTSVLPNFLVDGVTDAVRESGARVVYICNVATLAGETNGMDPVDHVAALVRHGLDGLIDVALIDASLQCGLPGDGEPPAMRSAEAVRRAIEEFGIRAHLADTVDRTDSRRHDPALLCQALAEVW